MANLKELIVNGVSHFIGKVFINDSHINTINGVTVGSTPKFTDTTALGSMTGTLGVDHGGTGKTTGKDAANYFMNALDTGSSTPADGDYYISQYVNGGTSTTTYHRRPMSALWEYIKSKINSILGLTATTYSGSAAKVNNHTVNSDVPSNAKFTDTVTTATTSGSGNAVTAITASNGALTVTKGTTFLTSHQDISGKADKSATVSNVAYDSTNEKITKTINGTTSDVVTVETLKTAMGLDGSSFDLSDRMAKGVDGDGNEVAGAVAEGAVGDAEGANTASGTYSHAEGQYTVASGGYSHAEGYGSTASGQASHAEGSGSTASGQLSHAEGMMTTASGYYSHAEGRQTIASGMPSHAEGEETEASGLCSHAEGFHTIAQGFYQHVIGKYNVANGSQASSPLETEYAFIIGNGTKNSKRSNAFAIKWNGTLVFANGTEITPDEFKIIKNLLQIKYSKPHRVIVYEGNIMTDTEIIEGKDFRGTFIPVSRDVAREQIYVTINGAEYTIPNYNTVGYVSMYGEINANDAVPSYENYPAYIMLNRQVDACSFDTTENKLCLVKIEVDAFVIFNGEIKTQSQGAASSSSFTGEYDNFRRRNLYVTLDGVEYVVPYNKSASNEFQDRYGDYNGSNPDFSNYPFTIAIGIGEAVGQWLFYAPVAKTYRVKIEGGTTLS